MARTSGPLNLQYNWYKVRLRATARPRQCFCFFSPSDFSGEDLISMHISRNTVSSGPPVFYLFFSGGENLSGAKIYPGQPRAASMRSPPPVLLAAPLPEGLQGLPLPEREREAAFDASSSSVVRYMVRGDGRNAAMRIPVGRRCARRVLQPPVRMRATVVFVSLPAASDIYRI